MNYVCTGCSLRDTEINRARPSLDDRYAVGYCDHCTPIPVPRKDPRHPGTWIVRERKLIDLVHPSVWNQEAFEHRVQLEVNRRLAKRLDPKQKSKYSQTELKEAQVAVAWLQR